MKVFTVYDLGFIVLDLTYFQTVLNSLVQPFHHQREPKLTATISLFSFEQT